MLTEQHGPLRPTVFHFTPLRNPFVSLHPSCDHDQYVFATVQRLPGGVEPVATVREPEGLTIVVRREDADRRGLAYDFVAAWIVLECPTDLQQVGLTAAFATVLAELRIPCNVIAGVHHDHLFVPHDRASEAVAAIAGLPWPARDGPGGSEPL